MQCTEIIEHNQVTRTYSELLRERWDDDVLRDRLMMVTWKI